MYPVKTINPLNAINKRIRKKLSKYKWDGPVFVAICDNSQFGCDWDDVAEVLYGREVIEYDHTTGYSKIKIYGKVMLMQRLDGTLLNTSLIRVLHCKLKC